MLYTKLKAASTPRAWLCGETLRGTENLRTSNGKVLSSFKFFNFVINNRFPKIN